MNTRSGHMASVTPHQTCFPCCCLPRLSLLSSSNPVQPEVMVNGHAHWVGTAFLTVAWGELARMNRPLVSGPTEPLDASRLFQLQQKFPVASLLDSQTCGPHRRLIFEMHCLATSARRSCCPGRHLLSWRSRACTNLFVLMPSLTRTSTS